MEINDFVRSLSEDYSPIDRELLQRAYAFAELVHADQKRASGEAYFIHCRAVASILAELQVPPAVIAAGFLHDTVEDTDVTHDDLEREFGEEIAGLVKSVTKLDTLPRVSQRNAFSEEAAGEEEEQRSDWRVELASENLRKTFLAMADDPRVVLIKLADRMHNMKTLKHLRPDKQKRIARETMDLFAPLASRLGIYRMKWDLEDLSFRYLKPDSYHDIANKLDERRPDREREMQGIISDVEDIMAQAGIVTEVSGRPKHIYSIYRKMERKKIPFEKLHDIRGVRILVADKATCYATVGVIHAHWRPIPGEFDDYIAAPKPNLYQAIHSAVVYTDGKTLEVQIRTHEMERSAEYGIAAHWRYKEGKKRDKDFESRVNYLRQMLDWQQDIETAQEYVNSLKTDVFEDRVYAFTPRGDIIDLPLGSTSIDFAYNIHTEVGHRCRGAKVNGRLVSLDHKLKTGDQVEILTSKRGGPSRDWLNENLELVKTQRARAKIKRWFKHQEQAKNIERGEALLQREMSRLGLDDTVDFEKLANTFHYKTSGNLFEAIGCGDIAIARVVNGLMTFVDGIPIDIPIHTDGDLSRETSDTISVRGLDGIRNRLARCCNPTPGDEIVGYITRGRGATVHRKDCPNILNIPDKERLVEVSWGIPRRTFPVPVRVSAYDRDGLTRDIVTIVANNGMPLEDLRVDINRAKGEAVFDLVLGVRDVRQLHRILDLLEHLRNVYDARRVRSA
ncbi:MAG: bifunctional (p)ppGpp synthetase/guanosine-3',5'-bis(diphosphate) 3'-pyrophosphohydrolase [Chloroflexota bacterium]|nr:bifunctional (p)ppGpp synthetase/guanosine-3',5'-bis(diphosphate) 3'-pyrophosphohydrolase [Chloroflexota bacterium]